MYKKYFVILHLPNNKGVRQTMRKYLKWLLPVIFIAYYSCITYLSMSISNMARRLSILTLSER